MVACDSFERARQTLKDQPFDALITDVRLGAFNGLQLAVMARDMYPKMRLIVFSGFDDPVLRADAEQIGATYLVKPVVSGELLKLLDPRPQTDDSPMSRATAIALSARSLELRARALDRV